MRHEATMFTRLAICRFILCASINWLGPVGWHRFCNDRLCAMCRVDFYGICPYGWLKIVIMLCFSSFCFLFCSALFTASRITEWCVCFYTDDPLPHWTRIGQQKSISRSQYPIHKCQYNKIVNNLRIEEKERKNPHK